MKLKVTSAGNKDQALSRVGAALYVITREDIASSGANNTPNLPRLVAVVEVPLDAEYFDGRNSAFPCVQRANTGLHRRAAVRVRPLGSNAA